MNHAYLNSQSFIGDSQKYLVALKPVLHKILRIASRQYTNVDSTQNSFPPMSNLFEQ